jgi:hypothetical protein
MLSISEHRLYSLNWIYTRINTEFKGSNRPDSNPQTVRRGCSRSLNYFVKGAMGVKLLITRWTSLQLSRAGSLKGQSSAPPYLFSTLRTSPKSLRNMNFFITCMLMTLKYMGSVDNARLRNKLKNCIGEVASWMKSTRLQFNSSKNELIWFSSPRRLKH